MIISPSYTFTRPANTTQYSANDLVANSATAGSVVPMQFGAPQLNGRGKVFRVSLFKDVETTTAASFKIHLFSASPVVTNGDNGAFAVSTAANYLGAVSIDQSSGATATSTDLWKDATVSPNIGFSVPNSGAIYGLLEAIGTYTPASGESFTVTLDIEG